MEQERIVGNEFSVDVRIDADASDFIDECLDSTISYADVYEIIAEEMSESHLLLESVTKKIADKIIEKWDIAKHANVKITKLAPPIAGIVGSCSVEYQN